ncbi:NADPH-dependent FMN reductase [Methanocaldococcus villosus KIN24-T80]|uniref:NADPH-dependent FMN reductase n=1 Tax=Methanocaldococcus villosus KIN24-T80 TaxID=1069083 RepID=N6VSE1_9EURY|nr:flavodoxin family protein [Methanocaldococcus villosus]ENN96795.1 NADPH-dependent FMN reductase [Methanocaldococcus villosus KIN24-T80]
MKVLGISGSPRLEGTHFAVNYALNYLKEKGAEVKYLTVHKKKINFCIHCDFCIKKREGCVFKDDMLEFYEAMEWADGIIIGTPVYQGTVSAQIKAVMDRTRAILAKNPNIFKNKVGMAIAVGGDRSGGQEIALRTIHDFFIINGIIPVSGGSFGANLGASLWSRDKGKEGVKEDEEGLRSLRKTLKRFLEMLEVRP